MTHNELKQLIAEVQKRQSEFDHLEVKAARGGTPKRLYEPLSAFANRTGGGVLLFGLDESKDFSVVGVGDVHRLQEDITSLASADMEPALRPQFVVDEIEDETVVAVEIEETSAERKPCFYKQAGLPKGAYLRVGNTNRITQRRVSSRGQHKSPND
jgi:ATP-dependent DNA helicase RecG